MNLQRGDLTAECQKFTRKSRQTSLDETTNTHQNVVMNSTNGTNALRSTIFEAPQDLEELEILHDLLSQLSDLRLVAGKDTDSIPLPTPLIDILRFAVDTMAQGNALSIESLPAEVTYQQAADLLGVKLYTLHRLVGEGALAESSRVFPRRCLCLHDVLTYRDSRNQQRQKILNDLTQQAIEDESNDMENPHAPMP